MKPSSLLQKQRRANDRYKRRLFIERLKEWQLSGRDPQRMPTLRTYHEGLDITLRAYKLTDEMHIARCGMPWPKKDQRTMDDYIQRAYSNPEAWDNPDLPHASKVRSMERVQDVRDQLLESPEAIEKLKGIKPQQAPIAIDFDALEQGK